MRFGTLLCVWVTVCSAAVLVRAADSTASDADGVVTWTPEKAGPAIKGELKPTRWGMYDVEARLESPAAGKAKLTLGDKSLSAAADGAAPVVRLGRVYLDTANPRPVTIESEPADAKKPLVVKSLVLTPAPEGQPIVQSGDLSITLHAHDATVHGVNLRYEFRPDKNTLGYWSNPKDWVSWDFEVKKPGKFIVVAMQGSPVSKEIHITCDGQTINYTTKNTGSYHTFTFLEVGTLTFDKPGTKTLNLKPAEGRGPVMDLRQVILLPVLK